MVSYTPLLFYPQRKGPWYSLDRSWVDLTTGLDDMEKLNP
jgi:hypothetical protein